MIKGISKNLSVPHMRDHWLLYISILFLIPSIISCSAKKDDPILLLATNSNFGVYSGEILKTEGFNEYHLDSLSDSKVDLNYLKRFNVVILAETVLDNSQKEMFGDYVKNGGRLIAFRPDKKLSDLFGIKDAGVTISEGYILTSAKLPTALAVGSLQFHGTADKYTLNGGEEIASLYSNDSISTGCPAIVKNVYGKGSAIAFLYNLPQSIVYTRQGNPAFAGLEKDGINGLRGMDLFTDGWVDTTKNKINQADEQMRILSYCIENMTADVKPLPRLWYFPDDLKCLVTLTNDGEYNNEKEFDPQFADVDAKGAKMTIYILAVNKASKAFVDKWAARGHEMVGHPDDTKEAANPHWNTMDSVLHAKISEIKSKYGITQHTNVNHWFVWCGRDADGNPDFAAEAKLEAKNGIGLDVNYAHYDNGSNQGHFLGKMGTDQGNYTGSGMVMKYCDNNGKIINVYQHFNNVYDQQYSENKDTTGFFNCFKGLMDRSLNNEVYSFISIKSHNWAYPFSKKPLMQMLDYSNQNGIPVWTALKLYEFMKMKDEAAFENITFSNNILSFELTSSLKHSSKLTFMVPAEFNNKSITGIKNNGEIQTYELRKLKGKNYAFISVEPGRNYNITVSY